MLNNPPRPKSVLSIDVGLKRIGLAGCDPLGITIKTLPAIQRGSFQRDLETLKTHCISRQVRGLVVGIPLDKEGKVTQQALFCKNYGEKMAKALKLPIARVNEHSSTWDASKRFNLQGDRTGKLDSAAAAILLDQWLREGPEVEPAGLHGGLIN